MVSGLFEYGLVWHGIERYVALYLVNEFGFCEHWETVIGLSRSRQAG